MIALHPYGLDDAPLLYEAARESIAAMKPWMPWCHPDYAPGDATAWCARQVANFADRKEFDFVITGANEPFLGACGLNNLEPVNRRANLGYWVRASARGRGIATEATQQLVQWTFENTDLIRLEVVVAVENTASIRVAEKAGAVREGVLRKRIVLDGVPHDAVMFSFVR